jgi:predicted nucleotidyltransferase
MISEKDKLAILRLARQYLVKKLYIFGSSADPQRLANDIDLGVLGLVAERFFDFYGDLIFNLSKPVDLVDLSKGTRFNALVKRDGIQIYG